MFLSNSIDMMKNLQALIIMVIPVVKTKLGVPNSVLLLLFVAVLMSVLLV